MALYVFWQGVNLKQIYIRTVSFLIVLSQFLWISLVPSQIPENKFSGPFFSASFFRSTAVLTDQLNMQQSFSEDKKEVKIVSDYLSKHLLEIYLEKYDEYGFYVDEAPDRLDNFEVLKSEKNACKTFPDKQKIIFLLSERSYRYSLYANRLASESLYNTLYELPSDYIAKEKIKTFKPNLDQGKIVFDQTNGNIRMLMIDCSK